MRIMSKTTTNFSKVTNDKMVTSEVSKVTNVLEFKEGTMKKNPFSTFKLDKV